MKRHFGELKQYIGNYNTEFIIGVSMTAVVIIIIGVIIFAVQNSVPKIVYQPTTACDLLKLEEARELLGSSAINSNDQKPVQHENVAISKCGYTNRNPDKEAMLVAALIVRSGVNDAGARRNKTEFAAGKPHHAEMVKELGDAAYFNRENSQLNILRDRDWIVVSFGVGASPESNTLDKAVEMARKVV